MSHSGSPLAMDTTGWLARFIDSDAHSSTIRAMDLSPIWFASELVLPESLVAIDRLGLDPDQRRLLEDQIRRTWDCVHRVPVDSRCLQRATELARRYPVKMIDALHLAAADRLPHPVRFLTHEAAQIPVAMALGFEVVSRETERGPFEPTPHGNIGS